MRIRDANSRDYYERRACGNRANYHNRGRSLIRLLQIIFNDSISHTLDKEFIPMAYSVKSFPWLHIEVLAVDFKRTVRNCHMQTVWYNGWRDSFSSHMFNVRLQAKCKIKEFKVTHPVTVVVLVLTNTLSSVRMLHENSNQDQKI